jgi:hypothetical protein
VASRNPERAARHVAYELGMLRTAFGRMSPTGPMDVVLLEVFLLHARNLIEFFFDGAPRKSILPKEFGAPAARDKDPATGTLRDDISQLLSHLTWDRVTVHESKRLDWSYRRTKSIHDSIQAKARSFFGSIPKDRQPWFFAAEFPEEYKHWLS